MRHFLLPVVHVVALTAILVATPRVWAQPARGAGGGRGFGGQAGGAGRGFGGPPRGGMMGFGGGMAMGGGLFSLLGNEAVQEELGLTKQQTPQAEKLAESYREEVQKQMRQPDFDFSQLGQMSDEQRTKMFAEMREKMEKATNRLNAKFQPRLKRLLKPEQLERLKQISYQSAGMMALQNEDVVKALEITKDQQKQIQEVNQQAGEAMREMFASFAPSGGAGGGGFGGFGGGFGGQGGRPGPDASRGGGAQAQGGKAKAGTEGGPPRGPGQAEGGFPGGKEFQEQMEKMRKLNEDRDAKVLAALTDAQREKFEQLKGEPFDLARLRPQGFGPPPGGPGQEAGGKGRPRNAPGGNERGGRKRSSAE